MDIRCPQCSTLYEFDETRIRGRSVNFKCSQCAAVFRVQGPGAEAPAPRAKGRWMIRKAGTGDILYFTGMENLQKWIIDRKVARADEISRTGKKWTALGDVNELSSFFQVAESIERVQPAPQAQPQAPPGRTATPQAPTPAPPPRHPTPPTPPKPTPRASGQIPTPRPAPQPPTPQPAPQPAPRPAPQAPTPTPRNAAPQPAPRNAAPTETGPWGKIQGGAETGGWSLGGGGAAAPSPPRRRGLDVDLSAEAGREGGPPPRATGAPIGLIGAIVVVVLLLGGAIAVYFTHPEWLGLGAAKTDLSSADASAAPDAATEPDVAQAEPDAEPDAAVVAAADAEMPEPDTSVKVEEKGGETKRRRGAEDDDEAVTGGSFDSLMARGHRFLRSGRGDKALQAFQAAAAQRPENSEAQANIGWAYLATGNAGGAIGAFQKAISSNSRYGDAYIGLGQAYRNAGQKTQALQAYERYLALYPDGPKASIARYQAEKLRDETRVNTPPTSAPTPPSTSPPATAGGAPPISAPEAPGSAP